MGEIVCADGKFSPRWCREYQRRSYAQIYSFAESCMSEQVCAVDELGHISASSVWLVTLTVQHSCTQSYRSMRETVENLRKSWNDIRRWVNAQKFRYLRVMEPGELNGYPHYHMVVIGADKDTVERLICRWLIACDKNGNKANVKGQDYRQADSIQNVGAYVCKYIQKSFQPDSDGSNMRIWWRWMELAYREHIRVYAMDRKSSRYIAKKYPRKDSGVCEIEIHSTFCDSSEDLDAAELEAAELEAAEAAAAASTDAQAAEAAETYFEEQTAPSDTPPIPHYCPLGRSACAGGVCEGRRRIMPILRRSELPRFMRGLLSIPKKKVIASPSIVGGLYAPLLIRAGWAGNS